MYISGCSFCNGNHNSRNCNIEQQLAPSFKKEVGIYMEEHITNNIKCPRCSSNKLYKLGNHTPSIDIVCTECKQIYEVKSKCLSVKNLPNDIFCNGGNYNEFINNIKNKELDLIIVLYGVNREKKEILIRDHQIAIKEQELKLKDQELKMKDKEIELANVKLNQVEQRMEIAELKMQIVKFQTSDNTNLNSYN